MSQAFHYYLNKNHSRSCVPPSHLHSVNICYHTHMHSLLAKFRRILKDIQHSLVGDKPVRFSHRFPTSTRFQQVHILFFMITLSVCIRCACYSAKSSLSLQMFFSVVVAHICPFKFFTIFLAYSVVYSCPAFYQTGDNTRSS